MCRRFTISVLIAAVLGTAINGQTPITRLSNAYGPFNEEHVRSSLDNFFIELQNEPGSRGLVVIYGNYRELTDRKRVVVGHIAFRKVDPSRIDFLIGGSITLPRTDLWVTPVGASGPKIEPEAYVVMEFGKSTKAMATKLITEFLTKLRNVDGGQGYMINYGTPRQVATREKWIRDSISFRRFDGPRITLVNGGPGPVRTVLWIVPPGAENPAP